MPSYFVGLEFMIENGSHSSGVMIQSNPTIWQFTVTPDNNQLPLYMWIPAGVCQDTQTFKNNNVSPLYTLTVEPPPVAILTVPASRHDYVYPHQTFSIEIAWSTLVSGFAASDIIVTNAGLSNLATSGSGVYTATITPSGGSPINYYIPDSVCVGIASHLNNIASEIYTTTYQYSSSPGSAGGGNSGSGGGIGGGIGSWEIGRAHV